MNYIFMPSLERRALIKTVITLWNPDAIHLDDIEWRNNKWNKEDRVIGKVKELPLPESLRKKISGFIKPIGYEILKWINQYQNILSNGELEVRDRTSLVDVEKVGKSLSKLCWTPQGTVDRKKTAEELIRDENLDISVRYKLACIYCLRNDILKLWNKMPEYRKKSFYFEEDPDYLDQNELIVFWTYHIKGELTRSRMNDIFQYSLPRNCTPYEYAFLYAVKNSNKVATEYFWQNVTSEKREEFLKRAAGFSTFSGENGADILYFLLSQMNGEQRFEVLEKHCCTSQVLKCFLHWPWQDFFMETANYVWAFLNQYDYFSFLEKIMDKVKDGYKDYDYKKLFRECCQQCPVTHKEFLADHYFCSCLLLNLLKVEDGEYFKIIFPSISDTQKLLFSYNGNHICERLIVDDKMDLLQVFVRDCMTSNDVRKKFKEEFKNHIHQHSDITKTQEEKRCVLNKLFQLLDELILDDDNRKRVDEGNTDPAAKRLCSHNK